MKQQPRELQKKREEWEPRILGRLDSSSFSSLSYLICIFLFLFLRFFSILADNRQQTHAPTFRSQCARACIHVFASVHKLIVKLFIWADLKQFFEAAELGKWFERVFAHDLERSERRGQVCMGSGAGVTMQQINYTQFYLAISISPSFIWAVPLSLPRQLLTLNMMFKVKVSRDWES